MISTDKGSWCVVYLKEDFNWWVHESSDDVPFDVESIGILDPKQIERVTDLLSQLRQYGLKDEIVSDAFMLFAVEKEMPKEMIRVRVAKDNIFDPKERLFCLPNVTGEQEGPFLEFIDHIIALRVKLLNASIDFQRPINTEEMEDILHAEQQERYISGTKTHAFDEIMLILDYVPAGYSLDGSFDDENFEKDEIDLSDFDDEVDDSLELGDDKRW